MHRVASGAPVITEAGQTVGLGSLRPGDIIKVQLRDGQARQITILRPAWADLGTPEQ